ncbi:hypothetical protein H1R20_g2082, partial [Candolleomyces eurysporus]
MDTHLSQFYGTNHVPSDTELLEIEKLLAPHNARLSQLGKDLEEAEAKIARLKKEREDVLRVIKPLKSLSSLIRRFPREIMELIFTYCMSATAPNSRPAFSICHAPLALLRSITTPRIREINYQPFFQSSLPNEAPQFSPALPLTSFLQRYGNRTEVLSVNLPTVSREDLQSWLECMPALKQLTLGQGFQFATPPPVISLSTDFETSSDDSCIDLLTPKQDQPYLCANLKIFRYSIKSRIPVDTILAFLTARTDPLLVGNGGIVEEVSIHQLPYDFPFGDSSDAEDERIKSIREAGVRLSFKKSVYYQSNPAPSIIDGPPGAFIPGPGYGVDFKLF